MRRNKTGHWMEKKTDLGLNYCAERIEAFFRRRRFGFDWSSGCVSRWRAEKGGADGVRGKTLNSDQILHRI